MCKRGWIGTDDPQDIPKVELGLKAFFRVKNLDEIVALPHAAKKTDADSPPTYAQIAWFHRVQAIADELLAPKYSPAALEVAIRKLHALTVAPEEARNVARILAECGVRLVIVESLPSAKIDGVCFWLDENSPVVGLSLRHDRIDNFWFVLRHELEHVLQGHGLQTFVLDSELEGEKAGSGPNVPEEERIANSAAQDFCVPRTKMDAFVSRKAPLFSESDLLAFAKMLRVHPGIVAGQLQHRTGRYDRFRQHLKSIRVHLGSTVAIDGWGDIYPLGA
jgi:HTH-type transcriptional regulator/antitoxin HigA